MRYIYEPGENELPKRARQIIENNDLPIDVVDTSAWNQDKRWDFYQDELMWRSVTSGKPLRGKIRTNNAGRIHFFRGVLVTNDNFFIGEDAVDELAS